jgi:predicted Zn-dependent peptidase
MSRFLCAAALAASVTVLSAAGPLHIPFKQYTLDNGLRVILSEDHSAPTYSLSITYDVGSRDEKAGHTGFAHLFEHMMFQGSQNVGKGEHFSLISNNGGDFNGTTSEDRTNYFENLPANQLDLGLFLESDRMRSLAVNQANLDNQRNAVQEEKRLGHDNQPYGESFDTVSETAYDTFSYKHSVIGSMEDLNAATLQDVEAFFKRYYAPNNAVLTLVGDFKSEEALAKIKQYFGSIPAQPAPPRPDTSEPEQKGERQKTIDDQFAQVPLIQIAYKAPPSNEQDFVALDVLGDILCTGDSSRLYQILVKEKQQALQVQESSIGRRGPSLIEFLAFVKPGVDPKEIEKSLTAEIERVKTEGVTARELEKIRMRDEREDVAQLQSSLNRAIALGQYAVFFHDPNMINTLVDKVHKVTQADIQRVAKEYLVDAHKTVVITMPKQPKESQ